MSTNPKNEKTMKANDTDPLIDPASWKGYDIDELRYRRAYLLARCEIQKMKLAQQTEAMKQGLPSFKTSGVAGRMLKGLSYMDYAYRAYRTVSQAVKIFGRFRHRK